MMYIIGIVSCCVILLVSLIVTIFEIRIVKNEIVNVKKENQTLQNLVQYYAHNNRTKTHLLKEITNMIKDVDSENDPGAMMVKLRSLRICMELQVNDISGCYVDYNIRGMLMDMSAPIFAPWILNIVDHYYKGHKNHDKMVTDLRNMLHYDLRSDYYHLRDYINGTSLGEESPDVSFDNGYMEPFMKLIQRFNQDEIRDQDEIRKIVSEIDCAPPLTDVDNA